MGAITSRFGNASTVCRVPEEGPIESLTERFRRGGNTEGVVGSGLGLTIAADVLAAHGGRLDLRNAAEGGGACVTLVLPSA